MFETAEKLEKTMQFLVDTADTVASVTPVHGKKRKFEMFWSKFNQLQEEFAKHIKALEDYQEPDYSLPFASEEFAKKWIDWQLYFLEQTGTHLGKIRGKKQAALLGKLYPTEAEATDALDYFINRGYTAIFLISQKNNENGQNKSDFTDWSRYEQPAQ